MPDESLIQVLNELNLNYNLDLDIPEADCPKDQSHKMLIDPLNRKTMVCRTCQIKGETLDLRYHKCLANVEVLTALILAELNEKNSSDYNIKEIGETQFRYLLEDISADLSINRYQINNRWKDSTLVELCNRYKFEVIPTPEYDHIAECRCPSGYSHRLTMNLETDSWYCGWCSKNGYLKELEMFFKEYNLI